MPRSIRGLDVNETGISLQIHGETSNDIAGKPPAGDGSARQVLQMVWAPILEAWRKRDGSE